MKMSKYLLLCIVPAMVGVSDTVYAREEGMTKKQSSGMQSRTQMQQHQQQQMQQVRQLQYRNIDTDGDGKITPAEVEAHERLTTQLRQQWNSADQNSDGQVDTSEFAAFRERVTEQLQEEQQMQQEEGM